LLIRRPSHPEHHFNHRDILRIRHWLPTWLGTQVLVLGMVSALTDTASEMVVPLLPMFITTVLGGGAVAVGLIDGMADLTNSVLQIFAGRRVDATGRRRPLVVLGYSISGVVRPLMALAMAPWQVIGVRVVDRVGKGMRTSPRESLLAAVSTPQTRGRIYGFHNAMDNMGQVFAPLLVIGLLWLLHGNLRLIFVLAALPGLLAVFLVHRYVREARDLHPRARLQAWSWIPPRELRPLLFPLAIFTLGSASDMFLLLKVGAEHGSMATQALLWSCLAVVKVLSALAGGPMVDRVGARITISLGWLVYIVIYLSLAAFSDPFVVGALFLIYGLFHGLTEGPQKSLVAALARQRNKGVCFGWYGLVNGVLALPAGLFFGWLWERFGQRVAFTSSAGFAAVALVVLWFMPLRPRAGRA
jgi:MFS family permease